MLFIKPNNIDLYKTLLFPIGMSHGVLFIAYLYLAFMIKEKQNWSLKDFSIVDFGIIDSVWYFFYRKKIFKEMHNFLEKIFGWLYPLLRKLRFGETLSSYISLILNIVFCAFWPILFMLYLD